MKKLYALTVFVLPLIFVACGDDESQDSSEPDACSCTTDPVEFPVGNGNVYLPNIFTPNFDGLNDIFMPFTDDGIERIEELSIFSTANDSLIFENFNIPPNDVQFAWDGFQSGESYAGQFKFTVRIRSTDGTVEEISGAACSFPCDGESTVNNPLNCAWPTQNDGAGGFESTLPSFEDQCF